MFGLALLALAGGATTARAATISTPFNWTGLSLEDTALYFNLTVGPRDIAIAGLKTHVGILTRGGSRSFSGFRIDTRDGPALGKELDQPGWTTASEGTLTVPGNGDGENQRSPVALKSKIVLKAGRTYGFRLIAPSGIGHYHTSYMSSDGNPKLRFANADLTLNFGSRVPNPFDADSLVLSRTIWNGEIQYAVSAVPLPAAAWLFLSALGALGAHRAWAGRQRRRPAV